MLSEEKRLTAEEPELLLSDVGAEISLLATGAREIGTVPLFARGLRRLFDLTEPPAGVPSLYLLPLTVVTTLFLPGTPTMGDVEMLSPSSKSGEFETRPWIPLSDSKTQSLMVGILLLPNNDRAVLVFVVVTDRNGFL